MGLKMMDKYDAKEELKSLWFLMDAHKRTKLDGAFQRWGGYDLGSGWTLPMGIEYLESLIEGGAFNIIINVDVNRCLMYANEIKCRSSIEYFNQAKKDGWEWVSLDGNNSASFITALLNDAPDVKIRGYGDKKRKRFSEFSEAEQKEVSYVDKVRVVTLREITVQDMCVLFRKLNTSVPLNPQEYRQARWTDLSLFVRDAANGANRQLFKNFIFSKESDLDKRCHEEIVAQLSLKVYDNYISTYIDKPRLDTFYEKTGELSPTVKADIKKILNEVLRMAEGRGPLKRKLSKGRLHNLFDVVQMLTLKQQHSILNPVAFFNWFLTKDAHFIHLSKSVIEAEKEDKSYEYWSKTYSNSQWYKKTRDLFANALAQDLPVLMETGIVCSKKKKTYYTWAQKLELMRKQQGLTRQGDEITYLDLYLGKLEADHMVSIKDGGETTIANGELMYRHENRSKGAHSNEPHFEHQK